MHYLFRLLPPFLLSFPDEYTAVPTGSPCRIFNAALSQGHCGSCAAFALATAAAMRICLDEHRDFIPSPYRLFDCADTTCDKGLSLPAAAAIAQFGLGDIDASEHRYGLPCDHRHEHQLHVMLRPEFITDPNQIKHALYRNGPLPGSVRRDATRHALVVVGWGQGHWIVQNSWGEDWGDGHGRGNLSQSALLGAMDMDHHGQHKPALILLFACMMAMVLLLAAEVVRVFREMKQEGV